MRPLYPFIHLLIAASLCSGAVQAADPASETANVEDISVVPKLQERLDRFEAINPIEAELTPEDRKLMELGLQDVESQMKDAGLKVGETAPDFTLPNAVGESVRLYDLLKKGPVVLTFYRGTWCPYCNIQLYALKETVPRIESYGAQLVAITPQKPEFSLKQAKEDRFPFQILSDLDSSAMKSYKLYYELPEKLNQLYQKRFQFDLAEYNGEGRYVLPVPGTFVIDSKAKVTAAFAKADYTQRMEPADIITALQAIRDNKSGT
jgi:peroxiredoxin